MTFRLLARFLIGCTRGEVFQRLKAGWGGGWEYNPVKDKNNPTMLTRCTDYIPNPCTLNSYPRPQTLNCRPQTVDPKRHTSNSNPQSVRPGLGHRPQDTSALAWDTNLKIRERWDGTQTSR